MSEQVNKAENHALILFKNNYFATEILIKEKYYFSFPYICAFFAYFCNDQYIKNEEILNGKLHFCCSVCFTVLIGFWFVHK